MNAESGTEVGAKLAAPFLSLLPVTGVAISVFNQGHQASLIYATDPTATALEELHFDLGEGPMIDVFTGGSPLLLAEIESSDRWPAFLQQAASLDVAALFVFPLTLGAVCIGAVLCYRSTPGGLGEGDDEVGESLGRAIAGPAFRYAISRAHNETPDGEPPIEVRREVHQATGIVTVQLESSATDAFASMRAYAFSSGLSLREVADDVVSRRLDFSTLDD